jgi:hypothetical protein
MAAQMKDILWEYARLTCRPMRDGLEFEMPPEVEKLFAELAKEEPEVRCILKQNFDIPSLMRLYELPEPRRVPRKITPATWRPIKLAGDLSFLGLNKREMSIYLFPGHSCHAAYNKTRTKFWRLYRREIEARINLRTRIG